MSSDVCSHNMFYSFISNVIHISEMLEFNCPLLFTSQHALLGIIFAWLTWTWIFWGSNHYMNLTDTVWFPKYPFYLILIILELELLLLLAKVKNTNCVLKFRKAPSPKLQRELSWKLLWFQKNKKGTFFMKPTRKPLDAGAGKVLDMDTWQSIRPEANLWINELKSKLVHLH